MVNTRSRTPRDLNPLVYTRALRLSIFPLQMGTEYGNGIQREGSTEKALLRLKRYLPLSSPDVMAKRLKIVLWYKGAEDL